MIRRAMVLAAGRGKRMRPLTDHTPKPLLKVCGRPLLDWHLERLAVAGVEEVVVNGAWLRDQIEAYVAHPRYGLKVHFSPEPREGGLETAGGIIQALPLLGSDPFIVVNGDVFTDFDFSVLPAQVELAHLVLVPSPPHNARGDFGLEAGRVTPNGPFTFAGISVLTPELFEGVSPGVRPLAPLLRAAMKSERVSGMLYEGAWYDIGTPERLKALAQSLGCPDGAPAMDMTGETGS